MAGTFGGIIAGAASPLLVAGELRRAATERCMKVITLVHGRERQLGNLILGLERSQRPIEGLWVVFMNEPTRRLRSEHFEIHALRVDGPEGRLPLARARNAMGGIDEAGDWIFLDVDCIPTPGLVGAYEQALAAWPEALQMGEVRYLPEGADAPGWEMARLLDTGVEHPLAAFRSAPGEPMPHHLFWSLNFACSASTFARIGGFDAGYVGYGGEDTDFAFRARACGVELRSAAAAALHQYHPTYQPPLNHFAAIVANARRFHEQWQRWPMEGWLQAFADLELIAWQGAQLTVLREPSGDEVDACFNTAATGF
jgi:hypothetical protein